MSSKLLVSNRVHGQGHWMYLFQSYEIFIQIIAHCGRCNFIGSFMHYFRFDQHQCKFTVFFQPVQDCCNLLIRQNGRLSTTTLSSHRFTWPYLNINCYFLNIKLCFWIWNVNFWIRTVNFWVWDLVSDYEMTFSELHLTRCSRMIFAINFWMQFLHFWCAVAQ